MSFEILLFSIFLLSNKFKILLISSFLKNFLFTLSKLFKYVNTPKYSYCPEPFFINSIKEAKSLINVSSLNIFLIFSISLSM